MRVSYVHPCAGLMVARPGLGYEFREAIFVQGLPEG